ncbi:hypothetical protein [Agromyces albus]|uniref:AbiEi antitoxin C-terminal domain-containing protein n=1 Tax=Agromyces albus TaxID=205332 RepID=A0A4Q2L840_9MICO|nr:hypothetical protein [Agromyces albus]RXZ72672.1 hypothetical protein ESP51_02385 [Agromyces albus]
MNNPLPADDHGLILFGNVRALGRQSELYSAVAAGTIERVRRGVYRNVIAAVDTEADAPAGAEADRLAYLTVVRAAARAFTAPVFTSYSAAALKGLPVIGSWPSEVFVLSRDPQGSRRKGVVTVARTRDVEIVMVDGCAVTAVEFTLLQLARHAPLVAALTATDAALHVPRFGGAPPKTSLERLHAEHERLKPYPRSQRADAVLQRATTLADTPLETGSRLLIEELGFAQPELQHELWLPELGKRAFLDFYWPEVNVGAEADGRGKYRSALARRDATGSSNGMGSPQRWPASSAETEVAAAAALAAAAAAKRAADLVIGEKDRENAIRRQVAGFDRWDWGEMIDKDPVAARLAALGVPRVRRRIILS